MNKINKYLLTGIVSLSMTACANLDLNPLSEGSSENWYHDETEIEMALNDLWRPDFFPIDAIYWDDDLLNRNGSNEVTLGTVTSQWGYRLQEDMFNSGLDIVVIARNTAKDISYHEVESALLHLGGLHKILK